MAFVMKMELQDVTTPNPQSEKQLTMQAISKGPTLQRSTQRSRKSVLNKEKLAREVSYLLDLPLARRHGKAYNIVTTIVQVLTQALQDEKQIDITGFGRFKITEKPSGLRITTHSYDGSKWKPSTTQTLDPKPSGKRVVFKPSKALIKYINHGNH